MKTLLIIVPDTITDILKKGEYPPRYYNPGELFDQIHLMMTNDDQPPIEELQKTVGRANLYLHNLPLPPFLTSFGWHPASLETWVQQGIALAGQLKPDLIRTHGNVANGYLAARIKKAMDIPLVVSLHINPDEDIRGRARLWSNWKLWLAAKRTLPFEKATLQAADWVLPVYEPIRGYAQARGAKHIRVAYNFLNIDHLRHKETYALHQPARIVSVGRQFKEKNPENLIRAAANLDVHLTLVGDGTHHDFLCKLAAECGLGERVTFHRTLPNDELCAILPDFDIFAAHSEYWEISKSVLEPLLTGLPVIINQRKGSPVLELQGDWVMLVENTSQGYYTALEYLLTHDAEREQLGRRAYEHAQARYAPQVTEGVFVEIYRSLLEGST